MSVSLNRLSAVLFFVFATGSAVFAGTDEGKGWDFGANSIGCCEKLGFDREQRKEVVRVMRRHTTKIKSLCTELQKVVREKPEDSVAQAERSKRVDAIKQELDVVQLKMRTDLRNIATDEQRRKWDQMEVAQRRGGEGR